MGEKQEVITISPSLLTQRLMKTRKFILWFIKTKIPSTWNKSINAPKFNFERSRTWPLFLKKLYSLVILYTIANTMILMYKMKFLQLYPFLPCYLFSDHVYWNVILCLLNIIVRTEFEENFTYMIVHKRTYK